MTNVICVAAVLVIGLSVNLQAYSPLPESLPDFYPRHSDDYRRAYDVTAGLDFIEPEHRLTIASSGNFAVLQVDAALYNTLYRSRRGAAERQAIKAATTKALSHFDDQFDFVVFTHNTDTPHPSSQYLGIHYRVSNDVAGLGKALVSQAGSYGSKGKLQSVIHLPLSGGLRGGPSLHEFMHRFANSLQAIEGDGEGHFGYTSVDGVLGGFDLNSLRRPADPNGVYEATGSGARVAGSGGFRADGYPFNNIKYSPLEMYLMGALAADRVPDVIAVENARFVNRAAGRFVGNGTRRITSADIIARDGDRVPSVGAAQNEFRVLYVVVTTTPIGVADWGFHDEQVRLFSRQGDDNDDTLVNFFEATDGFASVDFGGLDSIAHASVELPSSYTDVRVTGFKHRQTPITQSEDDNYWLVATISQTGPRTLALDGMRFAVARLDDPSQPFSRCGSNWAPFEFEAGDVINTGRIDCTIETAGRYQTVLQVRVEHEWHSVFTSEVFDVVEPEPADVADLAVVVSSVGPEDESLPSAYGQRHWLRAKLKNTGSTAVEIDSVSTVLHRLDVSVPESACTMRTGPISVSPGQTLDSGRMFCDAIREPGRYAIGFKVSVGGVWTELVRSTVFDVVEPPATTVEDIGVDFQFVSDPNSVVAGQVDSVKFRAVFKNNGATDVSVADVAIDVVAADDAVEAACVSGMPLELASGQRRVTAKIVCPTLPNIGTYSLALRLRVNGEEKRWSSDRPIIAQRARPAAGANLIASDVDWTGGSVSANVDANFRARVGLFNQGATRVVVQRVRYRLVPLPGQVGLNDVVCYKSTRPRTFPGKKRLTIAYKSCGVSTPGSYAFVVELRIAGEWYEKFRGTPLLVVPEAVSCSPPADLTLNSSNPAVSARYAVNKNSLPGTSARSRFTVSVAGRVGQSVDGVDVSPANYYMGIGDIRVSEEADAHVEPIPVPGSASAGPVAANRVIPAKGAAAWRFSFCKPATIEIDLDVTRRAINLNLANLLLEQLTHRGHVQPDALVQLSSSFGAIDAIDSIGDQIRRAFVDIRAGRNARVKRRLAIVERKVTQLVQSGRDRMALYNAFKQAGVRLGRKTSTLSSYRSYVRELVALERDGSIMDAIEAQFADVAGLVRAVSTTTTTRPIDPIVTLKFDAR